MTNAEKYKDAIMAQMCKTGDWAVNKSGEITPCDSTYCTDCKFHIITRSCLNVMKEWLNAEEKKEFSEKDKEVIRALDKVQWVVRNKNGNVVAYWEKPKKTHLNFWDSYMGGINLTEATSAEFSAIQWEDDEPTSRAEILGEEK